MALRNEDAIKKSVMNLVRTQIGERFFNSLLGTSLEKTVFELYQEELNETLGEEIRLLLENFEPRVKVKEITLTPYQENLELDVNIVYDIVGLPFPTQSVEFLLQSSRL